MGACRARRALGRRACGCPGPQPSPGTWWGRAPQRAGSACRSEYTHAGAGHDISPFPRLVLSCIDADRNEKWRIFQHFSKSTRIYTFFLNIFWNNQNLVILLKFSENSGDFYENSKIFSKIFIIFWKKCENRVDLEKRWKMRPLSLSEVQILLKFD